MEASVIIRKGRLGIRLMIVGINRVLLKSENLTQKFILL